jgi:hypothetical protein
MKKKIVELFPHINVTLPSSRFKPGQKRLNGGETERRSPQLGIETRLSPIKH